MSDDPDKEYLLPEVAPPPALKFLKERSGIEAEINQLNTSTYISYLECREGRASPGYVHNITRNALGGFNLRLKRPQALQADRK